MLTIKGLRAWGGILLLLCATAYAAKPEQLIIGKWQETGGSEIAEFFKDGTVIFQEGSASQIGRFSFLDENRIKLEVGGMAGLAGPLIFGVSVARSELVITTPDGKSTSYSRSQIGAAAKTPPSPAKEPLARLAKSAPVREASAVPAAPARTAGGGRVAAGKAGSAGSSASSAKLSRSEGTPPVIIYLWQRFPSLTEFDSEEAYKRLSTWLPDRGLRGLWLKVSQVLSLSRIEELAGLRIFLGGPHEGGAMNLGSKDSFGRYNPEFVGWLGRHAVPPRTAEFQAIYDRFFRRMARGYYASFEDLRANPGVLEGAKRAYLERLAHADGKAELFLEETFRKRADALAKQGHDWYEVYVAYGFWVRRAIDRTDQEFAVALKALLSVYDPDYLKRP